MLCFTKRVRFLFDILEVSETTEIVSQSEDTVTEQVVTEETADRTESTESTDATELDETTEISDTAETEISEETETEKESGRPGDYNPGFLLWKVLSYICDVLLSQRA